MKRPVFGMGTVCEKPIRMGTSTDTGTSMGRGRRTGTGNDVMGTGGDFLPGLIWLGLVTTCVPREIVRSCSVHFTIDVSSK